MKNNTMRIILIVIILMTNAIYLKVCAEEGNSTPKNELSFKHFLKNIERNNLQLLSEKFNIDIAEAQLIAAKIMPDPELTMEVADQSYSVELGYSLQLGNKRGARIRLARSETELSKLAVENFFYELRAESANAFVEAIMHRELLALRKRSHAYIYQLSQSDSIRYSLGDINENDARQSKLEASTMLNEVYQQEAEYKSALAMLNRYMGASPDTLHKPVGAWDNLKRDYVLSELFPLARTNRIDLVAAVKKSEIANNQLRLTKAERKMDLGLMVGYERDWHGAFPKREMLKAGVTVPLPFSNMNKGSVKSAQYAKKQSDYEYRDIQLEIETEVSQAFFYFEAAKKQVKQYQTGLLDESQKVLSGMVYMYQRGETSILDVLIAQRTYNEVQEQYLETMKNYTSALVNLERACGIWDIEF